MSDQSHGFPDTSVRHPATPRAPDRLLLGLAIAALVLGTARRALLGWDGPLSLDETWTGAIARAPDLATMIRRCLSELSGPVFYGSEWLWVKAAGASDLALRLPGIAAAIAAPLLILARAHPDRRVRLLWAGIAAVWLPATLFAADARPYSLVILLATAQTIALARFLRAPAMARAFLWSGITALMLLSHYHTLIVSGLQGIAILCAGRRAWRCWPALLVFVPVAAWMAVHLPLLLSFAAPGVAWYDVYDWRRLSEVVPAAMFGLSAFGIALMGAVAVTTLWSLLPDGPREVRARFARADVATALSGVGAVLIVVLMATVRPSFSPRYLLPFLPSILFGVALWGAAWSRRWPLLPAGLLALFLLLALGEARLKRAAPPPDFAHAESFEGASAAIAAAHPKRLFALFDGPGSTAVDHALLNDVAGFFLRRAGETVEVHTPALAGTRADPNLVLPALADRRGDAILWIYDPGMHGTRGAEFPADIARRDPRFACSNHGTGALAVIACVQR